MKILILFKKIYLRGCLLFRFFKVDLFNICVILCKLNLRELLILNSLGLNLGEYLILLSDVNTFELLISYVDVFEINIILGLIRSILKLRNIDSLWWLNFEFWNLNWLGFWCLFACFITNSLLCNFLVVWLYRSWLVETINRNSFIVNQRGLFILLINESRCIHLLSADLFKSYISVKRNVQLLSKITIGSKIKL